MKNLGIMHCINFAWYNKKGGKKTIRGPCPPQSYLPLTFPTLINMSTLGNPVDTGRKLNVHKTFRRRPGRLLNVLCTFSLRPLSIGKKTIYPTTIKEEAILRTS